eukprot:5657082-Prymnesium_polylepis.1
MTTNALHRQARRRHGVRRRLPTQNGSWPGSTRRAVVRWTRATPGGAVDRQRVDHRGREHKRTVRSVVDRQAQREASCERLRFNLRHTVPLARCRPLRRCSLERYGRSLDLSRVKLKAVRFFGHRPFGRVSGAIPRPRPGSRRTHICGTYHVCPSVQAWTSAVCMEGCEPIPEVQIRDVLCEGHVRSAHTRCGE